MMGAAAESAFAEALDEDQFLPYTLHSTPFTLPLTPYTLHPTPYTPTHEAETAFAKAQDEEEVLPFAIYICVCICIL
jgi:hypothetical protein